MIRVLQIPKSYLKLQEAIIVERERRDATDEVQYLTDLELEQIIEQTPDSDIKDYEDLQTGNAEVITAELPLHFFFCVTNTMIHQISRCVIYR